MPLDLLSEELVVAAADDIEKRLEKSSWWNHVKPILKYSVPVLVLVGAAYLIVSSLS
jgi:hypothetical protein